MKSITTKHDSSQPVADTAVYLFDDWFDPIEAVVRDRVRGFIQAMIEGELGVTLERPRYGRHPKSSSSATVSRVWRKVKADWDAWNARLLAADPIVRLILDGTVVDVRLDRKATAISLLVVIGVRTDGQKVLLAVK